MKVYFSDFFNVSSKEMDSYGAFNISLINDLPLFIDPFLLFGSKKKEYQNLHNDIIDYLFFLKNKSAKGIDNISQIKSWYLFSEVKQNWFGYSEYGIGKKEGTLPDSYRGLGYKTIEEFNREYTKRIIK